MPFTIYDLFIGICLMNAMPHLLFGVLGIRFLSLFGFGSKANLSYAALNIGVAIYLYHDQYFIETIPQDGVMVGALGMLIIYLITGRFLVTVFHKTDD